MKNLFTTLKNFFNNNKILILLSVALFYTSSTIAQTTVEIGTGSTYLNTATPIEPFYGFSYSQCIYTAKELQIAGLSAGSVITHIAYEYNSTKLVNSDDWRVYMGNVSNTSFSSYTDWIDMMYFTPVFFGTVTVTPMPIGPNQVQIALTTPYTWDGTSSIAIAVDENNPGFTSSSCDFYCRSVGDYRYITYYDDNFNPDPNMPPTASYYDAYVPNIFFTYTTGGGGTPGLWTGATSTAWNLGANWSDGNVPTGSIAVTIPSSSSYTNAPYVNISNAACAALTVQSGATLYCTSGSGKLTASSITINNGGKISISSGEIESAGKVDWDGNVTMSGGTLDLNNEIELGSTATETISGGTITLTTYWDGASCTSGFTPTGGTVYWDHASSTDQRVYAGSGCYFNNVTINGDVDQWSSVRIKGDLHILNQYGWDIYQENLYLEGDLITDGLGTSSWDGNDGKFFATGNSYFYLEGSANQSIGSFNDGGIYMYVNKTGGTVTQNGYIYCKYFYLGTSTSSTQTGTYVVDNETLKTNYYQYLYAGTMNVTGGLLQVDHNNNNGMKIYDPAVLNVSGGEVRIGTPSSNQKTDINMLGGVMTISGGTVNICDELDVSSTATNTITISAGTLNIGSYTGTTEGTGADRFEMDAGTLNLTGGTINIKGQYPGYDALDLAGAVTVNATVNNTINIMSGAGSSDENMYLDINLNELGNLTINNSGYTVYGEDAIDLKGDLTITSGTFNKSNQNLNLEGSYINNGGTFTSTGGNITFDGTGSETCDAISNAATDLHIDKTSGSVTTTENADFDDIYIKSGSYIIDGETITSDKYVFV